MEAERDMLKYCFAFDHINYARYMSFQHACLSDVEAKGDPAIDDLIKRGISGSLSGDKFSAILGDLITEVFNGETKRQVKKLKDQLKKYNTDPFGDGPAKQLTTGKIIDAKIIQGLLDAEKISNSKYLEFVAERLMKGTKKFFDPI